VASDDLEGEVRVTSGDLGERRGDWGVYVQAVVWALSAGGRPLRGWRGVVAADIPAGAGLSSSAALELAIARASLADDEWAPAAVARVCQRAENDWVGVESGIMDQLASAAGRRGHALLIDCRTLHVDHVALTDCLSVVVMDTGTRRELAGSRYNDRRAECAAAADALGASALRDATVEVVEGLDDALLRRRARHVVTENARTLEAANAMRTGDVARLGALLAASHASMRDDFEATSAELDAIVAIASAAPGCVGARVTGAGFGGCAVALVAHDAVSAFTDAVACRYGRLTELEPRLYVTQPADGTEVLRCA
jgi:galactokinase